MRIPDAMERFDLLLRLAAADGRGEALFGDAAGAVRPVYEKMLIGDHSPVAVLEFPLLGTPCLDLTVIYNRIERGAKFKEGRGYGYQPVFDWFSTLPVARGRLLGMSMDLGRGESSIAGVAFQETECPELHAGFFSVLGEEARVPAFLSLQNRMPPDMAVAYCGLFPGRPGLPMRAGGYFSGAAREAVISRPSELAARFGQIGFTAWDDPLTRICSGLMRLAPGADYQFDLGADGRLTETFSLGLSFGEIHARETKEQLENGPGGVLFGVLQRLGLADDRWKRIAGAARWQTLPAVDESGIIVPLTLAIKLNYVKVKFVCGIPQPAKCYFSMNMYALQQEQAGMPVSNGPIP